MADPVLVIALPTKARIRLVWRDKYLIALAFAHLWRARLRLSLHGFGDIRHGLDHAGPPAPAKLRQRIGLSITLAAHGVFRPTCLVQAMAAQKLLAGKGFGSRIGIGVRTQGAGQLEAHAWLMSGDAHVVGGLDDGGGGIDQYKPLLEARTR